jgi:hypothetical protein
MKINDLFDAVIVLNLDRRPDRLQAITHQLETLQITWRRWPAIDHMNTDMTPIFCNVMNNINRLLYCHLKDFKHVLLLDDDCEFVNNFYEKFDEVWPQIPDDWDTVSFGDHLLSATPITNKIQKIHSSYGGHATAIKMSCLPVLLNGFRGKNFFDLELNAMSDNLNRYAIEPGLVGQGRYESDMVGGIRSNLYNLWQ